jgi:transcriptional regulator with XRE-family HTH domain
MPTRRRATPAPSARILELARRVAEARARAGLTQAGLSAACGVTDETISRIERGRYEPAVSTLIQIAEALDVSLDQLAGTGRDDAKRRPAAASPIVRRLMARIEQLTPEAQGALLAAVELMSVGPHKR